MDIEPGTVVANRYRITRPLGRGGMGEVFAAENVRTGRPVAVKLLRAESKQKSSAVERFRREARAAGSINSDHVTEILDVEDDPERGIVLVFELLEGESLIDRLKRTGPISYDELFSIIEQMWIGLADAHRAGIIHRDLKPSNVFLEKRPDGSTRVKILDFGISKLPREMGGETLTEMGQSLGTFSFMPPEQIGKAKTVDHRADIYACATLIYQSLTGQLPYTARNILLLVEMKSKTEPRRLAEALGEAVDPRLEAFVARGLARDPGQRFQSAADALSAWRELRPPLRSTSQPGPPPQHAGPPSAPQPGPTSAPASSGRPPQSLHGTAVMQPVQPMRAAEAPRLQGVPVVHDSTDREPVIRRVGTQLMVAESTSDTDSAATIAIPLRRITGQGPGGQATPMPGPGIAQPSPRLNRTVPIQVHPSVQAAQPLQMPPRRPSDPPPRPTGSGAAAALSTADRMPMPPTSSRRDDSGMYPIASSAPPSPQRHYPQPQGQPPVAYDASDQGQDPTQLYRPRHGTDPRRVVGPQKPEPPPRRKSPVLAYVLGVVAFAVIGFLLVAWLMRYVASPGGAGVAPSPSLAASSSAGR